VDIVDKYEYKIKEEQMIKLIKNRDFATAAKIADGIDWRRIRNINTLTNVGSVYAEVGRYEDAKEIFLMAFERAPIGRRLAYNLTDVCIKAGNFSEAEHYYENFIGLAPNDSGRFELQYKMAKKRGEPVETLIGILQEYKKEEIEDMWAYELARLYHKAGMGEACVSACDEIILWFGEGEYVEKAMELKMLYMPLSPSQQEKYNRRFQPQMQYLPPKEPAQEEIITEQIPKQPVSVSTGMYNTENMQEALAESIKEIMPAEEQQIDGQVLENPYIGVENIKEPEQMDATGATKDLRYVQKALAWNDVPYTEKEQEPVIHIMPEEEPEEQTVDRKPEENMVEAGPEEPEEISNKLEEKVFSQPEKAAEPGRLPEEQRQVFAAFLHINGLEAELAKIFEEAKQVGENRDTSLTGNILVIGDHKSGKTTLATELMKNLSRVSNKKSRKIAKISGNRLNHKGIKETITRLAGTDLLVEHAGEMNQDTTQELLEAMSGQTGGMVVVLEDTKEGITRLIAQNPEIETYFNHKVILKEYEISEWVELAKSYAMEMDYGIDEMATLALSAKIDALYAQKTVIDMEDIKDIINAAIDHSEKKNIKKLFETVFSRKYKDSDLTMLRENDFV